ncbi:MAG: permease-like cell division protein FtsX, partial [Niameybacter sp.]
AVENIIKSTEHVSEVNYISKEEALETFANGQEDNSLFEQFKNDNPLPASFEIKVEAMQYQEDIVKKLQNIPELQVEYFKNESIIFMSINHSIQLLSSILIGCLIVIALLLITNTIKLTVYVRRKEINIMKYLGATDTFIRLPFVIEGILIGMIGSLIPIWIIKEGYLIFMDFVGEALGSFMGGIEMVPIGTIMQGLLPMFALIGIGIGMLGSAIAIRKHLKV